MKPLYSIEIVHGSHEKYAIFWSKNYGDYSGGVSGRNTAEECVLFIRLHILTCWEKYDAIISREPHAVTLKNTEFATVIESITLSQLLEGQQTLAFFEVSE